MYDDNLSGEESAFDENGDERYEEMEGFQITGGDSSLLDEGEIDWLAQHDPDADSPSPDPQMNKMTTADLQLGRFSHLEPRVQKGIQSALYGTLDARSIFKDKLDLMAASEEFGSIIGSDPVAFARQMKIPEGVDDPRSKQDLAMVLSVLQKTAGEYLDRGAGQTLNGNFLSAEKRERADEKLNLAFSGLDELADLYIPDEVRNSSVYGVRKESVKNQLATRLMDEIPTQAKNLFESSLLPLPSEIDVMGLVETRSSVYGSTSPHTRLSYEHARTSYEYTQMSEYEHRQLQPSLKNSLFPVLASERVRGEDGKNFTPQEVARDRKFKMGQAMKKAKFVRKQLLAAFPTVANESAGTGRSIAHRSDGLEVVYGDTPATLDHENLRNEQAILGLDYIATENLESSRMSETDLHTEAAREALANPVQEERIFASTPQGVYQEEQYYNPSPKQGTKEWLAQRRGNITASVSGMLLGQDGVENMAASLARQRLGIDAPFVENSYTKGGNKYEDRVLQAFQRGAGKGLTYEEAFYDTSEDNEGFGVSPDGRLFDAEGQSAGLLELKYLTGKSMKGALKKYTPQMQMQMAITGEEKTHFYAMNKHTGEYQHEIVHADPELQQQLLQSGQEAIELAGTLDARGVQTLEKNIRQNVANRKTAREARSATQSHKSIVAGQEARLVELGETAEAPMTAFREGGQASGTLLAQTMEKAEKSYQLARAKEAVASAEATSSVEAVEVSPAITAPLPPRERKEVSNAAAAYSGGNRTPSFFDLGESTGQAADYRRMEKEAIEKAKADAKAMSMAGESFRANQGSSFGNIDESTGQSADYLKMEKEAASRAASQAKLDGKSMGSARDAFKANQEGRTFGNMEEETGQSADYRKMEEEAIKANAAAARESSKSLQAFNAAVSKSVKVLGQIGKAALGGNQTAMDEVRLAAESGMSVTSTRGMRVAMEKGGMSASGINSTFGAAAGLQKAFGNEISGANKYTEIMTARGASNLEEVRTMELPDSVSEFAAMNPQESISMVRELMQGKSPEAQAYIGDMFGMTQLTAYNEVEGGDISVAFDDTIGVEAQYETQRQSSEVAQVVRIGTEEIGEQVNGAVSYTSSALADFAGSAIGSLFGSKIKKAGSKLKGRNYRAMPSPSNNAKAAGTKSSLNSSKPNGTSKFSSMELMQGASMATEVMMPDSVIPDNRSGLDSKAGVENNVQVDVVIEDGKYKVTANANGDELIDEGTTRM